MLVINQLSKKYQRKKETIKALNSFSYSFPNTGLFCVLGPSGSGKSTLLNLLALLNSPDSGSVSLNGVNLLSLSKREKSQYRRSQVALVVQENNLLSDLNVWENLALPRRLIKKDVSRIEAISLLSRVGLSDSLLRAYPAELSGGEEERIAVARALSMNPLVLLADEPTASLDDKNAEGIFSLLKEKAKERLVIVASHDEKLAKKYADAIIYLQNGVSTCKNNIVIKPASNVAKEKSGNGFFPFRSGMKLATHWLFSHPTRVIISIILSILAFTSFLISSEYSFFNPTSIGEESSCFLGTEEGYFRGKEYNDCLSSSAEAAIASEFPDGIPGFVSKELETTFSNSDFNPYAFLAVSPNFSSLFGGQLVGKWPQGHATTFSSMVVSSDFCVGQGWVTQSESRDPKMLEGIIGSQTFSIDYHKFSSSYFTADASICGVLIPPKRHLNDFSSSSSQNNIDFAIEDEREMGIENDVFLSKFEAESVIKDEMSFYKENKDAPFYSCYLVPVSGNYGRIQTFLSKNNELSFWYASRGIVEDEESAVSNYRLGFANIGYILLAIAFLSFAFVAVAVVGDATGDIRILRMLGTPFTGVFSIFFLQDVFFSSLTIALSSVAAVSLLPVLHHFELTRRQPIPIARFNFEAPLVSLAFILVTLATISFLVLSFLYKRKNVLALS